MNIKPKMLLALLLGASAPTMAQTYQLVWSDEFDNNTLGTNWNVETVARPSNNELQYYTARTSNVDVRDGQLVLTARRESYEGRWFTSGRVNSNLRVAFEHGKIEARVKLPRLANGLWPAFWLMGDDIQTAGWPACGEIDIMEAGHADGIKNATQERLLAGCIHWGTALTDHHQQYIGSVTWPTDITGDYHLFTTVWDADSIRCYLDNAPTPYYRARIATGTEAAPYFHKPFHILFNLAVGGDYPNIHNAGGITALPSAGSTAEMRVDYVRVYQREGHHNVRFVENDAFEALPMPAPRPTTDASRVVSIFSDAYPGSASGSFDTWGSPGERLSTVVVDGDRMEQVSGFQYVGFNFNSDYSVIDLSAMTHLHADVYVASPMTIGMTPVSKDPSGDYTKNREHTLPFSLKAGWNSLDVALADYTSANPAIDLTQLHQMKWDGGDSRTTIYLDNIYFYRALSDGVQTPQTAKDRPLRCYTLAGRRIADVASATGIYICNGKKFIK